MSSRRHIVQCQINNRVGPAEFSRMLGQAPDAVSVVNPPTVE